jgi:hypothetical protein
LVLRSYEAEGEVGILLRFSTVRAKSTKMRVRQVTQQDGAEVDFVHLLIVTPQTEVLTFKGLPDKATMVAPLDISLGIDQANLKIRHHIRAAGLDGI